MAAAVRSADTALKDKLQAALDRNRAKIAAVLKDYAIPIAEPAPRAAASGAQVPVLTLTGEIDMTRHGTFLLAALATPCCCSRHKR